MSPNPSDFIAHLRSSGYHSRSNKHSNSFCGCVARDLAAACPYMLDKARQGSLTYDLNFTLRAGTADWNVDLVLGNPPPGTQPPASLTGIPRMTPSTIEIAIEVKSVMTEHRKAVKNRKRDFEAHHEHVHHYNPRAIAGGCLIVNAAPRFQSPLRQGETVHKNPRALIEHCLAEFRAVAMRGGQTGVGLDAKAAVVIEMDNANLKETKFAERAPAPAVGDPMHYDAFIQKICSEYKARF